ncbi:hypothetical protein JYU34_012979 [Plutella xylostella]|uniref:FANCI solenoid 4 domain-containing protein n=1 Tax=Plutella xylostella TaxID=51655 RepID=A0ABQ7QCL3_PLUXY|nr:hypothetical protein JYU34_012979 [Plutella xylostella]
MILQLEDFVRRCKIDCLSLAPALLAANCRLNQDAQFLDDLLMKVLNALGRIDEEDTSADDDTTTFPSIDARTGHAVFQHLCTHAAGCLKHCGHLLARTRDLQAAGCVPPPATLQIDREIQATNKAIVTQLTQISVWAARLSSARCSVGAGSDKVLSLCINLYTHLTTAVKRCHTARLEPLLKVSCKKLSSCIDNTISYVESSVQPSPSRVLRDTKLIPRLVLRAEQYQHALHEHAHKHKLNWSHYLSLGTARDFRIKAPALQEALARDADDSRENNDEGRCLELEEPGINDAETTLPTPEASDEENDDHARKKRRVS